jgi:hypothetical protein
MSRRQPSKSQFIGVRMSVVDVEALRGQAAQSGLTISELIRRRVMGQPVTSRTDDATAGSIDRLGRMLKHLYPKDKDWVSSEERKRWWSIVTELERTAKALRR